MDGVLDRGVQAQVLGELAAEQGVRGQEPDHLLTALDRERRQPLDSL